MACIIFHIDSTQVVEIYAQERHGAAYRTKSVS